MQLSHVRRALARWGLLFALFATALVTRSALAAPEAHILRIDPRASQTDGAPVLTTVVELVQTKPLNQAIGGCASMTGAAELNCVADALEKPGALWTPLDFPDQNAYLTVAVDGTDIPAKFVSKERWGESASKEGVGTAWLLMVDAAASMGSRFDEAKAVAGAFITSMRPNDVVNVMFFNDRSVVSSSGWTPDKAAATNFLSSVSRTFPANGRTRPLGQILQNGATDGFKELGNVGLKVKVPMHQAMVVLSSGASGTDAASVGPFAKALSQFMTKGRFPEDNVALPKMPVPVVSVWFPSRQLEELFENSRQFMESLANTEIGGFYSIVGDGQSSRAERIIQAVRARFDKLWIVKWQVACVAPSVTQTFRLFFKNTDVEIAPDGSFQNVPVGIDPQAWPLDIDLEATKREAEKNPVYPGGRVKIFGTFCWGGNEERAELYMLQKNQEVPESLKGSSLEDAKNAQRTLIESGMRGVAKTSTDTFVEFEVPDKTKFLSGKGDKMSARLIIFDNGSKRTSGVTADRVIELKASEAPLPYLLIGGAAFGGVVVLLLIVSIVRGGGGRGRAPNAAPPPPPRPMGAPMPSPMGAPAPAFVSRATLAGAAGTFTVVPGTEQRAGRDASACSIYLAEPRVSGTHATLKIEGGALLVRDEGSNNGTTINGQPLGKGVWSPVPQGALLRFGPIDFTVTLH